MPRDYKLYLEDILEAIAKIQQYTEGLSPEMLSRDPKTLDAVVRNLEVIGEAVKILPDEVRSRRPDVAWRKIAGLRNRRAGYSRLISQTSASTVAKPK
jgi:uncharacterized protein with HEPN domain